MKKPDKEAPRARRAWGIFYADGNLRDVKTRREAGSVRVLVTPCRDPRPEEIAALARDFYECDTAEGPAQVCSWDRVSPRLRRVYETIAHNAWARGAR